MAARIRERSVLISGLVAHWKLTLAYDGSHFHGWQVQPKLPTVQGVLMSTLEEITGERVLAQGSGRTDAGVHALAQVASLSLEAPIPAGNLLRALNRALPPAIRVLGAEIVPAEFHARYDALRKSYEYRIFPRVPSDRETPDHVCSPFVAPFVWDCPWFLDLARAQDAARCVVGEHDFTSFAAVDPELRDGERAEPRPAVRTIFSSEWVEREGLLVYRVAGSGFLHHMVRNLVGTMVHLASRGLPAEEMTRILAARDRSAAAQTAPASGLFLVSVDYPQAGDPEGAV